jgi:hypothetical protein
MLDSAIQSVLQATLLAGLAARNVTAGVMQNNQPRQFVAPSTPTVFHTLGPRKQWGWPGYQDTPNVAPAAGFTTTKSQVMHTTFQIAGCCPNASPATPDALTSGDLAAIANSIMTDEVNLAAFVAAGFNVFRVQHIPAFWFKDSTGQNVLWAPFDIIFTHKDVYTTSTGSISDFNGTFDRV